MLIHLIRHAEAIEPSSDTPEEHRFLTRRGRKRFRKVAKTLRNLGMQPDVIVASPLLRAVQTADILAETLRGKSDLLVVGLLAPGFSLESLDQLLKSFPKAKEIALIGHEPDLGILAQALLSAELSCALKKGMALSVRRAEGSKKADFIRLVTGGGLIITSTGKALDRLQA